MRHSFLCFRDPWMLCLVTLPIVAAISTTTNGRVASLVLEEPSICYSMLTREWLNADSRLRRAPVETAIDDEYTCPSDPYWQCSDNDGNADLGLGSEPAGRCDKLKVLDRNQHWFALDFSECEGDHAKNVGQASNYKNAQCAPLSSCAPDNVAVGCVTCHRDQLRPGLDFALPPPTLFKPIPWSTPVDEVEVRRRCYNGTQWAATFQGSASTAIDLRAAIRRLDGAHAGGLGPIEAVFSHNSADATRATQEHYYKQMEQSHFGMAPRGDRLFSYRMVETMASGAVPIVISDGYVFPFEGLIDWNASALVVAEDDVERLPAILGRLKLDEVCERRVAAFKSYNHFLATPAAWAAAITILIEQGLAGRDGAKLLTQSSYVALPDANMSREVSACLSESHSL